MLPILVDEGLPWQIAAAFVALGLTAHAVGDDGAPTKGSSDQDNVKWCATHGAILVTNDRGRKDRTIVDHLATHHVHALFILKDLRTADAHHLARALLAAEAALDDRASRSKGLIRARLRPNGGLDNR